ncbi:MAG: hypothetical protein QNJ45_20875 [Ardenticatenaceae bacterium]|nr:hypothetical protein [Ardenticatenaceae bacterium]
MNHLSKVVLIVLLLILTACGSEAPEATQSAPAQEESTAEDANSEEETAVEESAVENEANLEGFPVSLEVCGESVTFDAPPERAIIFEANMLEIM